MDWRVADSLQVLLAQLNALAPNRSRVSDGAIGDPAHQAEGTGSEHNPNRFGVVCARDFTHDPPNGLDCHELAAALVESRDPRIKYIIWNWRILDSRPEFGAWQWKSYSGVNGHTSHLHLSVHGDYDDESAWALGDTEEDPLSALSPDEQREVLAALRDIRTDLSWRYLASGKTDSAGRVLDRVGAMLPLVDNAWIARQKGGIAPGTLTNAIASVYRFVFEQLDPRLSAMAVVLAQIAEDDNTTVTLSPEQLADLKTGNGATIREQMAALAAQVREQLAGEFDDLAEQLSDRFGLDKDTVTAALNDFYGGAIEQTKENA